MEIILLERVGRLGNMGEKVTVKDGFARNFLLPRNKAVRATKSNLEQFETKRATLEAENAEKRTAAQGDAKKYEGLSITLIRQASDDGKLYGSVMPRDVEEALAEKGFQVGRQLINLNTTVKNTGTYPIGLQLHPEVEVTITLNVARNEAAANASAAAAREAAENEAKEAAERTAAENAASEGATPESGKEEEAA